MFRKSDNVAIVHIILLPDLFFDNVRIVYTLLIVCCVSFDVFYCGFMNL